MGEIRDFFFPLVPVPDRKLGRRLWNMLKCSWPGACKGESEVIGRKGVNQE